jgi:hypothetical protein
MGVIVLLSVSPGSSIVQLHNNLGNRPYAHVQRLISVFKTTTVLEGCSTEELRFVVSFFMV